MYSLPCLSHSLGCSCRRVGAGEAQSCRLAQVQGEPSTCVPSFRLTVQTSTRKRSSTRRLGHRAARRSAWRCTLSPATQGEQGHPDPARRRGRRVHHPLFGWPWPPSHKAPFLIRAGYSIVIPFKNVFTPTFFPSSWRTARSPSAPRTL